MKYPERHITIQTLLHVADRAGRESTAQHPEDIMLAMQNAMEGAAVTLTYLARQHDGNLKLEGFQL